MLQKVKKSVNNITTRDTLFGDLSLEYWAAIDADEVPWTLFKEAKKSIDKGNDEVAVKTLQEILAIPGLESRQYLQAYYFLNELAMYSPGELQLFGVVAEISMEERHDFLAVYADHSARYYNYSGSAIIWDTKDNSITNKIDDILKQGIEIVGKIGPWKDKRPAPPKPDFARINFLTSHGLHFGEAPQSVLFSDPMSKGIMYAMLDMMETLISKTGK